MVSKELRECTNVFFVSISNEKKEREICEFQFCCCSNLSNDDTILEGQVWEWVWVLEANSENGCEKWHFLVWNRVWIWRIGRHTPTKNSVEDPPGDLGLDIRTPPTSFTSASSYKDVSMVTSECVIEPSEKGTQTSAKRKRRLSVWAALVRERTTKMQFFHEVEVNFIPS